MSSGITCLFNSHRGWGGGEKWHLEIAVFLQAKGRAVLLAAHQKSELFHKGISAGLPVEGVRISNLSFLNPFTLFRLIVFFRTNAVGQVILNLPADLKSAGVAARVAGVRKIIYRRGSAIPIKNTLLNRFLFKYVVTDVIANSKETKRTVLANNPKLFPERRIHVIYNGIDLECFDKSPVRPLFKRKPGELALGHAGRLSGEKNQRFLIDVARELKSGGVPFRLFIAGQGELEIPLKEYANDQGVAKEVVFLGFVEDIKSFMASIDVFLLSSLWEGFGYVLVEAMAAGKPIVAFNSSSTPEIVDDGQNGFLVEPNNVHDFTEKILRLDDRKRHSFGLAGRTKVEKSFEFFQNLEKLQRLLEA